MREITHFMPPGLPHPAAMRGRRRGFTLVEAVLTLALIGLVAAALIPLFGLIFGINENAGQLARAQSAAQTQMAVIEQRLRYAAAVGVDDGAAEFSDAHSYLFARDGKIYIKEPNAPAAPLNADLSLGEFAYGVSFSAQRNSRVVRVELTVSRKGQQVHKIHSEVYPENLTGQSVTGALSGGRVAFSPVGKPVTGITITADTQHITKTQQARLTAAVVPADAGNSGVVWGVSDTSIAVISQSGVLTPLRAGQVTVTATAADGSGVKSQAIVIQITNS